MTEDKHFRNGLRARQAVLGERELLNSQSGKTVNNSTMVCPICGAGMLSWHMMPNGHLHMSCSTPECIQWIE